MNSLSNSGIDHHTYIKDMCHFCLTLSENEVSYIILQIKHISAGRDHIPPNIAEHFAHKFLK